MSWKSTKEAIRVAVIEVAGLPAASRAVDWNTRPQPFGSKIVTLNVIGGGKQEGPARVVKTWNEASQSFDVEISKVIVFTASFRCEDLTGDSLELAEAISSGLQLPSTRAKLTAAGVAIVGIPEDPTPIMGYAIDQRDVSAYSFDLQFRHELHRADPTQVETIEHVKVSGTVDGAAAELSIDSEEPSP